jgi:hypothetical protein
VKQAQTGLARGAGVLRRQLGPLESVLWWRPWVLHRRRVDWRISGGSSEDPIPYGRSMVRRCGWWLPGTAWVAGLLVAVGVLAGACSFGPLLYDVTVSPTGISPNADGNADVTRIEYKLRRNAMLSIYLVDAKGTTYYFRQDRLRSRSLAGQSYRVDFGGIVPTEVSGFRQDRVLDDGEYTLVLEAIDEREASMKVESRFTIRDADLEPPYLEGFSLDRHTFTPNRDGVDDRVTMSYYLTKEATVQVYLLDQAGTAYPIEEDTHLSGTEEGAAGPHYYDYEGGVDRGAEPPADGPYIVVAFAEDKVGNKVTVTDTLEIQDGGVPRATIDKLQWEVSSLDVPVGGTLYFTATVVNYGNTPIRTTGPEPGTEYTTDWNAASLGYYTSSGAFRFGIGFQDCPIGDYPWRWSVGRYGELTAVQHGDETLYYLQPGQRALITGSIRILSPLPRQSTVFWAGLIQEDVEVVNARVDPKWINVDEAPTGPWGTRATPTPIVKGD